METNREPTQEQIKPNEQLVLEYLRGKKWVSPTKIGYALHPSRMYGSPWASPICKRLVNKGLLQRNEQGHYRNPQRQIWEVVHGK